MKHLIFLIAIFFLGSCATPRTQENTMKPEQTEDGEWKLDVFDSGYETFLLTQASPMHMYSEEQLKIRNQQLVNEWNSYYYSGRYRNIVESGIEYDPRENYGLEFEYRLYQVFAYVSYRYGLALNGLASIDRHR